MNKEDMKEIQQNISTIQQHTEYAITFWFDEDMGGFRIELRHEAETIDDLLMGPFQTTGEIAACLQGMAEFSGYAHGIFGGAK